MWTDVAISDALTTKRGPRAPVAMSRGPRIKPPAAAAGREQTDGERQGHLGARVRCPLHDADLLQKRVDEGQRQEQLQHPLRQRHREKSADEGTGHGTENEGENETEIDVLPQQEHPMHVAEEQRRRRVCERRLRPDEGREHEGQDETAAEPGHRGEGACCESEECEPDRVHGFDLRSGAIYVQSIVSSLSICNAYVCSKPFAM